ARGTREAWISGPPNVLPLRLEERIVFWAFVAAVQKILNNPYWAWGQ
ncbi:uncharacterized protein METZ01_LOCUS312365, partial [marine metagenome]